MLPAGAARIAAAGVGQGQGPDAKAQVCGPGGTTEIQVIEVETQAGIERHASLLQHTGLGGQEHPIEEFGRGRAGAIANRFAVAGLAVVNGTDQMLVIPAASIGE